MSVPDMIAVSAVNLLRADPLIGSVVGPNGVQRRGQFTGTLEPPFPCIVVVPTRITEVGKPASKRIELETTLGFLFCYENLTPTMLLADDEPGPASFFNYLLPLLDMNRICEIAGSLFPSIAGKKIVFSQAVQQVNGIPLSVDGSKSAWATGSEVRYRSRVGYPSRLLEE